MDDKAHAREPHGRPHAHSDAGAHPAAPAGENHRGDMEAPHGEAQESMVQVVSFFLSGQEYAFDVADAVEVLKPKEITKVPRTPGFIKGILSVRGEMVAVFDLRERLGILTDDAAAHKRSARILIAGAEETKTGFVVDRMGGVRDYPALSFEKNTQPDGGFLKGVIRLGGRVINILDIASLTDIKSY